MQRTNGIYKRKDNRYEARFIKHRDENGKAVYGSLYAHSYHEAVAKLERVKLAHNQEADMQQTITAILRRHLEVIKPQIKPSTYGVYSTQLENRIAPYFSEIKCAELSPSIVQDFVNKQIESGLSAKSAENLLIFLKKGLDALFPRNYEITLPGYDIKGLKIFTCEEQKRLESAAKYSDAVDHIGITLSLYTGVKPGELCGLMWQDVDFDRKLLHIRRTAQRIKTPDGKTKTAATFLPVNSSAQRSIPLADFLTKLLKNHHAQATSEYVISKDGNPIEVRYMQNRFARLLDSANISPAPFQTTRDTFAARALEKGFDLKSLGEILGHSTILVTIKKYGQLLEMDEFRHLDMNALVMDFHG